MTIVFLADQTTVIAQDFDTNDVEALLADTRPGWEIDIDHILEPIDVGLFPIIGKWERERTDEEIEEQRERWDGWADSLAPYEIQPIVLLVRQHEETAAIALVASLEIPTDERPGSGFGWGVARQNDYDGDGHVELAVVQGYTSYHAGSTYGEMWTREISWFSFHGSEPIEVQAHLVLQCDLGGRGDVEYFVRDIDYEPRLDEPFTDIEVETTYDDNNETSEIWVYDPSTDRWVEP